MAHTETQPTKEELLQENKELRAKVEAFEKLEEQATKTRSFVVRKLGSLFLLGPRLKNSLNRIQEGELSKDNVSEVIIAVLYRITRIGLFALIVALVPIGILTIQTIFLNRQNDQLTIQNNLIEANRRSSLVFMMSNVLDKVDEEIKDQRILSEGMAKDEKDSTKYSLSAPLIGRIIALSRAFKPYRGMEANSLLGELKSPERGQLLIALMNSNLESTTQNTIVSEGDFSHAVIGEIELMASPHLGNFRQKQDLFEAHLKKVGLSRASLRGAGLRGANIRGVDLRDAYLRGAYLCFVSLEGANLQRAVLLETDFRGTKLKGTNLRHADLHDSNLSLAYLDGANLQYAELQGANLNGTRLKGTNLSYSILTDTKNITFYQLREARSLYECRNLEPDLEKRLRLEKPCLFTERGCE